MIQPAPLKDYLDQAQRLLDHVRKGDLFAVNELAALTHSLLDSELSSTDRGLLPLIHILMQTDLNAGDIALITHLAETLPSDALFLNEAELLGNLGALEGAARVALHFNQQTAPPRDLDTLNNALTPELAQEINQAPLPKLSSHNQRICELAVHLFEVHKTLEHQLDKLEKEQLNAPGDDSLTAKIRLISHAILIAEAITDHDKREVLAAQALKEQLAEDITTLGLKVPVIEQSFGELVWAVFQAIYFLFNTEAREEHDTSKIFEDYKRAYDALQQPESETLEIDEDPENLDDTHEDKQGPPSSLV